MTRLAFVSNTAAGEYTGRFRWATRLRSRGWDVSFILPHGEDAWVERIQAAGIPVLRWRLDRASLAPAAEACATWDLARHFRRERFDIVHAFGHKANVYTALAAALAGRPRVFNHVTGLGELFIREKGDARRRVLLALYRVTRPLVEATFFQNRDDYARFSWNRRILSTGTGVDTDELSPRPGDRASLGLRADAIVVTYVGRLLYDKGVTELLAAARALAGPVIFLLVGGLDPGNARSLRREDVRDEPGIRFLGRRDDVREILAASDIFVNPSYREGLSRTNLEAMAMALPVVTTDVPGCRDTVTDGVNGLLVPPRDAAGLQAAIERLVVDAPLRRRLGDEGRRRAVAEFFVDEAVRRIEEVYRRSRS